MTVFSKAVAATLLLVLLGVPVMACVAPNAQLTEEEKSCCRKMANQCASMDMPSDHSCCQKTVQQHDVAIAKDIPRISAPKSSVQVASVQVPLSSITSIGHFVCPERLRHPPPQIVSSSSEILRI